MPKGMTQSWIAAQATLPPEWHLMGVALGPREVDPQIRSESWVAWARGPNGARVDPETRWRCNQRRSWNVPRHDAGFCARSAHITDPLAAMEAIGSRATDGDGAASSPG
jgi:hypothetical protein